MANQLYMGPRPRFLSAQFDWVNTPCVLTAWSGGYVFDETHDRQFRITAAGGVLMASSLPMTGYQVHPGGYALSDPAVIPMPAVPTECTFFILMEANPIEDQNICLLYIDEALGLPFTPNGLDQIVQPDWLFHRGWFRP